MAIDRRAFIGATLGLAVASAAMGRSADALRARFGARHLPEASTGRTWPDLFARWTAARPETV